MSVLSSDDLNDMLDTIRAELAQVQPDADTYARLKAAPAKAADLRKRLAQLDDLHAVACEREGQAERERFAAGVRNLSVIETLAGTGSTSQDGVLGAKFLIRWEQLRWTGHENEWTEASAEVFQRLSPDMMNYLLRTAPEKLPASITALCPESPDKALSEYFAARDRGYVRA